MSRFIVPAFLLGVGGIATFLRGKVDIDGQRFRKLYDRLEKYNADWAAILLRQMIRFQYFKKRTLSGKPRAIDHGFDTAGWQIQGLEDLGYTWIIVGPVSYEETPYSERSLLINPKEFPTTLGVRFIKGRLGDLRQFNSQLFQNHQVGVSVIPSEQILIHTPYLMIEDITKAVAYASAYADFIVLNITQNYFTYSQKFTQSRLMDTLIDKCHEEMQKAATQAGQPQSKLFLRFDNNLISRKLYENPKVHGFILPKAPAEIPLDLPTKTIISQEDSQYTHVILQNKLFL